MLYDCVVWERKIQEQLCWWVTQLIIHCEQKSLRLTHIYKQFGLLCNWVFLPLWKALVKLFVFLLYSHYMCTCIHVYVKIKILFEICITHFNNKVRREELCGIVSYLTDVLLVTHNLHDFFPVCTENWFSCRLHTLNETVTGIIRC